MEEYKRICPRCGKEFVASSNRQIYCSRKCQCGVVEYKRTCLVCGKEFATSYSRQKACSEACSEELGRIRARQKNAEERAARPPVVCPVCGKEFVKKGTSVFCSSDCRLQAREAERAARPPAVCAECGSPFVKTGARQIYCSTECRISANRNAYRRMKESFKTWKPKILDKSIPPKVIRASRNEFGDPIARVTQGGSTIEYRGEVAMFYFQRATEE